MAARLLALVAAVAMVVGSLAVRSRIDDGDGAGGKSDLRLVCSTELGPVCEALEGRVKQVSVEAAGVTATRLATDGPGGPSSLDGWLVPSPWPDVVRNARQRNGLEPLVEGGRVLARSPLVLAVWPTKASAFQACLGGQTTWRCWGDLAVQGRVKPGHADVDEAVGAATVGAATASFFQDRPALARSDLEDNDDYRAWLSGLERSVTTFRPLGGSALQDMLLKGPVDFDAVGTIEAEAGPSVSTSARPEKPMVIYPSPVATVDVVLATFASGSNRPSRAVGGDAGLDALAENGWRVPRRPLAAGVPPQPDLPPTSGLPEAGVLDFLRTLAKEVSR